MNARGERILIFGDSLTHAGADNGPEIANISPDETQGSSPGSILGALLLQQGAAAVQTDSRVGRSAINFWQREDTASLLAADQQFAPTQVIVMLGTNDIGNDALTTSQAMQQIKSAYEAMGATVWGIGPMIYVNPNDALNDPADIVYNTMRSVFGARMLDARPLSINVGRASDGVHFGPASAQQTALNLADGILSLNPMSFWPTLLIGLGVLGAVAIGYTWWSKRQGHALGEISDEEWWASMHRSKQKLHGVGDRVSTKPPHEMSKDQIVRELDKLAVQRGRIDEEGRESFAKLRSGSSPSSKRLRAIEERESELSREYTRRGSLRGTRKKKTFFAPSKTGSKTAASSVKAGPTISDREFESAVQTAANMAPEHHGFGPRKVFIHRVYERARELDPAIGEMSLTEFKRRLVANVRHGHLRLARADLVAALDPQDISASDTAADGASYNFVERS